MSEERKDLPVDVANRCIDRNSDIGKVMAECQSIADANTGTPMGNFMNQILAYTDVATFVDQTMTDKKQARQAVGKLRDKMNADIDKMQPDI